MMHTQAAATITHNSSSDHKAVDGHLLPSPLRGQLLSNQALELSEYRVSPVAAPPLGRSCPMRWRSSSGHCAPLRRFPPTFSMQSREQ
jgi:hypothetical protein